MQYILKNTTQTPARIMTRFLKKKKTVPYIVKNMIVAVKYSHTKNTGNGRKPSKNKRI